MARGNGCQRGGPGCVFEAPAKCKEAYRGFEGSATRRACIGERRGVSATCKLKSQRDTLTVLLQHEPITIGVRELDEVAQLHVALPNSLFVTGAV